MIPFLAWYLLVSITGWLAFPLVYRLLPGLPDRGYAFARTIGWLLWGFAFWLLGSLGILRNEVGGLLFALLLLVALSAWAWRGLPKGEIGSWLRSHRSIVLAVELLFLAAFGGWALVRAANPEIYGTEKPMELAFLNAILRSPVFPPHDPWLSGYAISYYYFGYVLVAMLARLAGTPAGIAFNLGIALVFALSALGAYGMVFNLLAAWAGHKGRAASSPLAAEQPGRPAQVPARFTLLALLGPLLVLLTSNLEGLLEVLHGRGLLPAGFWSWLGILDLNQPPAPPYSWLPRLYGTGSWWWWRASRVISDYDLLGNSKGDVISEFPFFSYLLADLHPHVLAMPFAFLAMALALNLFLGGAQDRLKISSTSTAGRLSLRTLGWLGILLLVAGIGLLAAGAAGPSLRLGLAGAVGLIAGGFLFSRVQPIVGEDDLTAFTRKSGEFIQLRWPFSIDPISFLLGALVLGGLAFLNTWDFPFYVALFAGAYAFQRRLHTVEGASLVKDFLLLALAVGITGVLFYLPFYLGFSSQAGGLLPNLIFPTRGAHLWVMFGPLFFLLGAYLIYLARLQPARAGLRKGFALAIGLAMLLWVLSLLYGALIASLPTLGGIENLGDFFMSSVLGSTDRAAMFREAIVRRLASLGGWATLVVLLALTFGMILKGIGDRGIGEGGRAPGSATIASGTALHDAHYFALLLILLGTLLVLGPEFFYLRDQFGYRINTIFKFYYQAWLLWSVAAAFGTAVLLSSLRRIGALLFSLALLVVLGMALTYTLLGLWDKTSGFSPATGLTLDGTAYFERDNPDEMAAIRWLQAAPPGTLVEAVGGSYSGFARVATLSGQPGLLGWPGHEVQWRGGGSEMGSREADIARLYCSRNITEAQDILTRYGIRYVFVGNLERSAYAPGQNACPGGLNEAKFTSSLDLVFKQGSTAVYAVP